MTAPKIPLVHQVDAVRFAETRQRILLEGRPIRELRAPKIAQEDLPRLNAAARTLEWLQGHEANIKAFLALPAEAQEAVLRHGETMGAMCLELAAREAEAKAGGPVR